MKIVCGACGAKYSIADEKVQGKVFKIRCKKCSNVIVVKGTADDGDEAAAGGGGGAAEWYVVIDNDQAGPMTSVEVDSYFMSGRINGETFAWRDGLADWVPIKTLSEFAHLAGDTAGPDEATQISDGFGQMADSAGAGGALAAAAALPSDEDATISMTSNADTFGDSGFGSDFGAAPQEPEPSFGSDSGLGGGESGYSAGEFDGGFSDFGGGGGSADSGGGGFAAFDSGLDSGGGGGFGGGGGAELASSGGGTDEANAGMFASFDSGGGSDDFLGFSSGGAAAVEPSSSPAPAASNGSNGSSNGSANNMIGQRNENSVLFSLSSLDQVQAVQSPEPAALSMGGPAPAGGDASNTEGSGLIDIRALATAHSEMKGAGGGAGDNLDPFSAGTMAMPALMPMGSHRSNKPLIIGGILAGVLLLAVAGVAIALIVSKDDTPQVVEVEKKEEGMSEAEKQQLALMKQMQEEIQRLKESGASAEEIAAAEEKEKEIAANAPAEKEDDKKSSTKKKKSTRNVAKAEKKEEKDDPAPKTTKKVKKGDGIDALLNKIDEGDGKKSTPKKKEEPKKSSSGGKSKLSKNDVQGTIRRYRGRVNTCYRSQNKNNLSGTMKVGFAIKPDGGVTNVSVKTGKFAGTDVGKCVVKAVKGMKFPATTASSNVNVKSYPFKLQ